MAEQQRADAYHVKIHLDALLSHCVPQELQFVLGEFALSWVGHKAKSSQGCHNTFTLFHVVLQGVVAVDTDIVKERDAAGLSESAKGPVHCALELLRGSCQSHG